MLFPRSVLGPRGRVRFPRGVGLLIVVYLAVAAGGFAALARAPGDYGFTTARSASGGTTILAVRPGGALDLAGVRPGDVVLGNLQTQLPPGANVVLTVRRPTGSIDQVPVVLLPRPQAPDAPDLWTRLSTYLEFDLLGGVYAAIGVAVVLLRPRAPGARLLLVVGLLWGFQAALFPWEYAAEGQNNAYEWLAAHACRLATALFGAAFLHLFLAFPAPKGPLRWLRTLGPAPVQRQGGGVALLYTPALLTLLAPLELLLVMAVALVLAFLLASVAAIVSSYRHPVSALTRAQLKWIIWGVVVLVSGFLLGPVYFAIAGHDLPLPFLFYVALAGVLPASIALAVLRYRLFDVDIIINRTLVYACVTAVLAGTFAALSIITQRVALAVTGQESQSAIIVAALVVTALFQPLRGQVQRIVDRRFYRAKYDATRTLERFAGQVRDEVELDHLTAGLVAVVQDTMHPAHASLWLRPRASPPVDRWQIG